MSRAIMCTCPRSESRERPEGRPSPTSRMPTDGASPPSACKVLLRILARETQFCFNFRDQFVWSASQLNSYDVLIRLRLLEISKLTSQQLGVHEMTAPMTELFG